jgi:hypothetical protein
MKMLRKTKIGNLYLVTDDELDKIRAEARCELANYILFCYRHFEDNDDLFSLVTLLKNIILFLTCQKEYIPNNKNNVSFKEYINNEELKKE